MNTLMPWLAQTWGAVRTTAEAGQWNLPELQPVWIKTAFNSLSDETLAASEQEALGAAEADRGWLRYQSAAFEGAWSPSDDWREPTCRGRLLWAEWAAEQPKADARAEAVSYRITPDPQKPGFAVRYTYHERSDATDGFHPALRQEAILLGHQPGRNLVYHVYWGAPERDEGCAADGDGRAADESAIRRLFARFVRFNGEVRR